MTVTMTDSKYLIYFFFYARKTQETQTTPQTRIPRSNITANGRNVLRVVDKRVVTSSLRATLFVSSLQKEIQNFILFQRKKAKKVVAKK
jgi:hypothetical protein